MIPPEQMPRETAAQICSSWTEGGLRRHRTSTGVSLQLSTAAQAASWGSALSGGRQTRSQPPCVHRPNRCPLCSWRMPALTRSHKGREIDRRKQRGGKTITMTIFKCDQSFISEECRKIKISKFYLFACPPTHCRCTGKSWQAEADRSRNPLSLSLSCHLLF